MSYPREWDVRARGLAHKLGLGRGAQADEAAALIARALWLAFIDGLDSAARAACSKLMQQLEKLTAAEPVRLRLEAEDTDE